MNREYGNARYTTSAVSDRKEGYAALELHRAIKDETRRVARVVFCDASGQFFFETFDADIPSDIAEELIAEAKKTIKVR
jgi:hypothetical protein